MTLFLLMSCASSGTDKDSADASATADVTLSAAIDGTAIDPVEASIHEVSEDIGSEPVIANGMTGSPITVPLGAVRAWIGPASAEKSSDGYRIYERDGFHYVHELADFPVVEDCEDTVELNVMPAVENTNYSCVADQTWSANGEPAGEGHHAFVQQFVAKEGKYFLDPNEQAFDHLFGANSSLMTTGTTLGLHNEGSVDEVGLAGTEVRENGFTLILDNGDVTTNLTCVKQ